jgi:hypothetical protein
MQSHRPENIAELVEFTEAEAWANYYHSAPSSFTQEYGVMAKRSETTWMTMLAKLDWAFFNRISCLGVRQEATEAALDEAVDIFKAAGCKNFMAQVSPLAKPAQLYTWLEQRGFKRGSNWAKVYRGNEPATRVKTDLRVAEVGGEFADKFAEIALSAFKMPPELGLLVSCLFGKAGWHLYLAFDGTQPVSAGAMYVTGETAWLGFGSTLATQRKRGGQGAIFNRRIEDGIKLGCKWFVTETGEDTPENPNPSYHNMIRHGFKLAYLRPNYVYQEVAERGGKERIWTTKDSTQDD